MNLKTGYEPVRNFTELKLTDAYGEYSVRLDRIDVPIEEVFDIFIRQLLLAAGYSNKNLAEWIGE